MGLVGEVERRGLAARAHLELHEYARVHGGLSRNLSRACALGWIGGPATCLTCATCSSTAWWHSTGSAWCFRIA